MGGWVGVPQLREFKDRLGVCGTDLLPEFKDRLGVCGSDLLPVGWHPSRPGLGVMQRAVNRLSEDPFGDSEPRICTAAVFSDSYWRRVNRTEI